MTDRFIIHLGNLMLAIDSDDSESLQTISDFCKDKFDAVNSDENELTAQSLQTEAIDELYRLLFKLSIL